MDYSNFRRSENVDDDRNAPWSSANFFGGLLGMARGPLDTLSDAVSSLQHPFTPLPRAQFDITPSPAGSLSDQIGRNDLIAILKQHPSVVDLIDPNSQINPHLQPQQLYANALMAPQGM